MKRGIKVNDEDEAVKRAANREEVRYMTLKKKSDKKIESQLEQMIPVL